ncbi:MAG: Uncharacterised protein [SAR116 cluster bacterium]|nr:MAG: Uncharacterised protein [SAR116 cluster bacterium]
MQLGHDDFSSRHPFFRMYFNRNAPAIIGHCDRAIGIEHHLDDIAMTGKRLVNGIINHLIDHMMQARAVIGVADIHARPLAHRIKPLQDLD